MSDVYRSQNTFFCHFYKFHGFFGNCWQLFQVLRSCQPFIFHSRSQQSDLKMMILAWLLRVPVRLHTFSAIFSESPVAIVSILEIWEARLICYLATEVYAETRNIKLQMLENRISTKVVTILPEFNDNPRHFMRSNGSEDRSWEKLLVVYKKFERNRIFKLWS